MILMEIKRYICQQKEVLLPQLAAHFDMPVTAMEAMADVWVKKAVIEKLTIACDSLDNASQCGSCSQGCALKGMTQTPRQSQIIYRVI